MKITPPWSRVTFTQPASVTCLPISALRSELQSCVRNIGCAQKVPRHSERSERSRKRLASGKRTRPACWRSRPRDRELFQDCGKHDRCDAMKSLFRRDAGTNMRNACAPRNSREVLMQLRLDVCNEIFVRHELLLAAAHILDFHLRPLISIKKRDASAQIFSGLELPTDFGWRERVINTVAVVAQLLDLCERVGTALFLRDHDVDVDLGIVRYRFLHRFACAQDFIDQFAQNDIAHGKTERRHRNRAVAKLPYQIVVA